MATKSGDIVYRIYRALTYGISPLLRLHLQWRRFRGREHPIRWRERLGRPSEPRPAGRLIWFHAVSLGEGLAAIPVIKCCLERRPDVTVLMTTTTTSAFEVIRNKLPSNVIYQISWSSHHGPSCRGHGPGRLGHSTLHHCLSSTTRAMTLMSWTKNGLCMSSGDESIEDADIIKTLKFAPLDIPFSMDAFLKYWRPNAVMLMESELWPNLIMGASRNGVALALLNGRMSTKSFRNWSHPVVLPLITLMLSKFSLIIPLSTIQGIQFQLLQAPPFSINYSGDLKYALGNFDVSERDRKSLKEFKAQLSHRKVWMASSIHKGEEEVFIGAHNMLKQKHADIVTIIVPRQPQHGKDIAQKLREEGICVALRSRGDNPTPETSIYVVDSLGELRNFYTLTPIAVIGGSFLPGLAGHNISEAAAAGCALLTGHHVGHFSHMVAEMQRVNPLSVLQVTNEKLIGAVNELFDNVEILEARRAAAKQAFDALSNGIVESIWEMLHFHVFMKSDGCNGTRS